MRPPGIRIGGPSYCMTTDARHTVSVGLLSQLLRTKPVEYIDYEYKHGTPVDIPRNKLFESALKDKVDILVWMDSDCFIKTEDVPYVANCIHNAYKQDTAFSTFPTIQRDGDLNIWVTEERLKITDLPEDNKSFPVDASGLGFGIFVMRNFRKYWNRGPWFCTSYVINKSGAICFVSEDFAFTSSLACKIAGQQPICHPGTIIQHVHRGGHDV